MADWRQVGSPSHILAALQRLTPVIGHGAPSPAAPGTATTGTAVSLYVNLGATVPTQALAVMVLGTWYWMGTQGAV